MVNQEDKKAIRIAIFEKVDFSVEQRKRLDSIGNVDYFNFSIDDQEKANDIAPQYDIVAVNWIDPSHFILNMKANSLVALMCTGYGYVSNLKEAKAKGILIANTPDYSTEAVAEHLLGLLLGVSKRIFPAIVGENGNQTGFELSNKTVGIIGLGRIGTRFAEIMRYFGASVITTNRTKKYSPLALDITLNELLNESDIICITCSVNSDSRDLINNSNVNRIKTGAVLISCVWDVFNVDALAESLATEKISFAAIDATINLNRDIDIDRRLLSFYNKRLFLTPWNSFNTFESKSRKIETLCDNIVNFANGNPINII